MITTARSLCLALAAILAPALVSAQSTASDLLIKNAKIHTATAAGTLNSADVLIRNGKIVAIGTNLPITASELLDARGLPLTPGLFGGVNTLGVEDVSLEIGTVDHAYTPAATMPAGEMELRPEFSMADAFNPDSVVIPVQRVEGVTFNMVRPSSMPGGSLFSGLGGIAILDGRANLVPSSKTLFIALGSGAAPLTGNSRAAQLMILRQAFAEAKNPASKDGLLTDAGRATLAEFSKGGRVAFSVDRAVDIERAITFAKEHGLKPVILGGTEAWKKRDELAAAKVTVVLDPLNNLPSDFDSIGASLKSAAWLHEAGVPIAFMLSGDAAHNARKLRQAAGNAVAHGLDWETGLRAITVSPARTFGITDRGEIAVGQSADLVLWSGDPLDVTSIAVTVWIDGKRQSKTSHQTELRERYRKP